MLGLNKSVATTKRKNKGEINKIFLQKLRSSKLMKYATYAHSRRKLKF